jgi:hypothetical protein
VDIAVKTGSENAFAVHRKYQLEATGYGRPFATAGSIIRPHNFWLAVIAPDGGFQRLSRGIRLERKIRTTSYDVDHLRVFLTCGAGAYPLRLLRTKVHT